MAMEQGRWVKAGVVLIVIAVVGALIATLGASLVGPTPAPSTPVATAGPSAADLEALAAELSSGDADRIAGALADIPIEAKQRAVTSLGSLESVSFDAESVRFDAPTGAALVDARLVATDGTESSERIVLVERLGRWRVFSTLQQPGATPLDTAR
jgi:hypothetical protein